MAIDIFIKAIILYCGFLSGCLFTSLTHKPDERTVIVCEEDDDWDCCCDECNNECESYQDKPQEIDGSFLE